MIRSPAGSRPRISAARAGTVLVADAVKTEAAHAPLGIPCVGQGIDVRPGRKVREEGRIEDRHLPRLRQGGLRRRDDRQSRQIVQRGHGGPVGDALPHRRVDRHALRKLGPAVNDAVSYDLDIRQGLRAVGMCFRQGLHRAMHRRRIVAARRPCGFVPQSPRRCVTSTARDAGRRRPNRGPRTPATAQAGSVNRPNFRLVEPALKTRMLMVTGSRPSIPVPGRPSGGCGPWHGPRRERNFRGPAGQFRRGEC